MTQKNKTPWIERRIIFQDLEKTDSILPPNSELKDALNELQQEFGIGVHDMNSYRNILYTKDMILFNSVKDNKYRGSDLTRTLELCPYKRIHEILEEQTMHEAYKKEENQHSESHIKNNAAENDSIQDDAHPSSEVSAKDENEKCNNGSFDISSQTSLDDDCSEDDHLKKQNQTQNFDSDVMQELTEKMESFSEDQFDLKIKSIEENSSNIDSGLNITANEPPIDETADSSKINDTAKPKTQIHLEDLASVTPLLKCRVLYEPKQELLEKGEETCNYTDLEETKKIIAILEETLQQFNIEGRVVGIQRGPIITRFEVKMAPGIKVNRILALTDELAMALEALRVRIEAPIPGRSTVGIEIPNKKRIMVLLGDILCTENYRDFEAKLPLAIGKDIAGNLVMADLTKLPHLLIAGATGAGKSVSVNSFIVNFILNKSPEDIRFLMIDPKLVELSQYNDIPHLLHPVITDPQKAVAALNWAVEEMERRYEDLADARVRDIANYNERIEEFVTSRDAGIMPYIVVLVDELGDLMMIAGKEVEASIIRLSQKARAVGIHLILATQRPSVDVITALIKANCPARIALQVAQKTDSRTILDSNGAEQLLGQGDSLFKHPTKGQLIRIQAPLVSDYEVENVVQEVRKFAEPRYILLEDPKSNVSKLDSADEALFEESWEIILESQKASASYLQRRLRIGYNKAARLIEALEARGYIGPQIGSKPREIFTPGGT